MDECRRNSTEYTAAMSFWRVRNSTSHVNILHRIYGVAGMWDKMRNRVSKIIIELAFFLFVAVVHCYSSAHPSTQYPCSNDIMQLCSILETKKRRNNDKIGEQQSIYGISQIELRINCRKKWLVYVTQKYSNEIHF